MANTLVAMCSSWKMDFWFKCMYVSTVLKICSQLKLYTYTF